MNLQRPKVTILISTANERLYNISLPEFSPDFAYIIVHQVFDGAVYNEKFDLLNRVDVSYFLLPFSGLAKSRNFAISKCQSEYALISDDDVKFDLGALASLVAKMERKKIDIGTGLHKFHSGKLSRSGRMRCFTHNIFTVAKVSSIDICIDISKVRGRGVSFDENFGLGSKYPSGEEYIFLVDCIKKGMAVNFIPEVIAEHPDLTSGSDFFTTKDKILAKRKMFARAFGWYGFLFTFLFWLKKAPVVWRRGSFVKFTRVLFWG